LPRVRAGRNRYAKCGLAASPSAATRTAAARLLLPHVRQRCLLHVVLVHPKCSAAICQ